MARSNLLSRRSVRRTVDKFYRDNRGYAVKKNSLRKVLSAKKTFTCTACVPHHNMFEEKDAEDKHAINYKFVPDQVRQLKPGVKIFLLDGCSLCTANCLLRAGVKASQIYVIERCITTYNMMKKCEVYGGERPTILRMDIANLDLNKFEGECMLYLDTMTDYPDSTLMALIMHCAKIAKKIAFCIALVGRSSKHGSRAERLKKLEDALSAVTRTQMQVFWPYARDDGNKKPTTMFFTSFCLGNKWPEITPTYRPESYVKIVIKKNGLKLVTVKWRGYDSEENTDELLSEHPDARVELAGRPYSYE